MSKRAWYRCNERKAKALIEQGITVRYERGIYYYQRRVDNKGKKNGRKRRDSKGPTS